MELNIYCRRVYLTLQRTKGSFHGLQEIVLFFSLFFTKGDLQNNPSLYFHVATFKNRPKRRELREGNASVCI